MGFDTSSQMWRGSACERGFVLEDWGVGLGQCDLEESSLRFLLVIHKVLNGQTTASVTSVGICIAKWSNHRMKKMVVRAVERPHGSMERMLASRVLRWVSRPYLSQLVGLGGRQKDERKLISHSLCKV